MTKTLSLPVCRKLSDMGIEVEAEKSYTPNVPRDDATYQLMEVSQQGRFNLIRNGYDVIRAYQLDELPAVLREIGEKKGWSQRKLTRHNDSIGERKLMPKEVPEWEYHWYKICSLYASTGSLGEGSEAERYILDLIK